MQPTLCSRCNKNVAVIFITKLEGGQTKNEGLCLKCARELGIKPIDDMMKKMGITDEELDNLTNEMMSAFGGAEGMEGLMPQPDGDSDGEDDGRTATFPFLNQLFGGNGNAPAAGETPRSEKSAPNPKGERPAKRKFLENYCISLTKKAQEGKLDKLIGRDRELERVIQILNRRQKNNPCLIGEPGVGKTAIAEGLAMKIAKGQVPYKLLDKEVYLLDLTALVAGTQFRGQFESRMKGLIEEIRKLGNIILVIDEVHNIVGAGDAEGSMNAANILKPALSRGELQVIGATTLNEYRKHIEKDTALERRFQPVIVEEPSIEESVKIIEGIAPYYEAYHQVSISPEMCRLAVTMSERYITDRYLPDKAIDLIDEACSNVNLKNTTLARQAAITKELADLNKEKEVMMAADTEEAYARLANIRSQELRLEAEQHQLEAQSVPALEVEHLANVIELWTNIPASQIREQEYEQLSKLEERLKKHIIGQDEAVKAVAAAIRRGRVGISPKHKPVSFIFVGSTGVGKTELVKQLAQDLFHAPESLIRLDMSEFMEKYAVSRIIGSPPGYVGYDEAGQLTEKIRRKPYSVVLFDEIEKAHPDVLNILLQILDDGHITDAHGRKVNFENTVIVMTSNAGSNSKVGSVGFDRTAEEQGKERAMKALQDFLRPEFINRVDEIVYFHQLTEDNFKDIAALMLQELKDSLAEKHITLTWDESLLRYLVKKSYSAAYGARNLRRCIQKELEDVIAQRIIDSWQNPVTHLNVLADEDKIQLISL
ncbi:MAG: ATP-dependent Clp protease ATP-binding subunit [Flintibacter sp.]|uniref:ATP-dependent Clp protease ATP-binding subunit n=1 Tax=Flintibacter TaxID=1918454 RepID=UPI002672EAE6|nr:ATP-dependent Clp protease ATP-binding subunit [Flintibacter sp.]MCI6150171.1 ATP-dependent Clp protease ATP-binding subunit [Flintibacter sp.]MCI7659524.1 ATP-dependent Clp protease ATP-binding subunit [Flintibacter sp.]MDD7116635.1 ATP-dependent Clp protease ATP-binding subunit [Flintibacter sp.]MDY5037914.1 ATP-dependent Clp protease ATP-binding subunit [Lawsonibacter sp.]